MEKTFEEIREEYDAVRKELDKTLGLSFCKLLELHPLYDHRIEQPNADAILSIVLVGRGQPLDLLRDKVLSNGQLLDTKLEVTVVTPEAEADMARTTELNPALYRFIRIRCTKDGEEIRSADKPEWEIGTLTFEQSALTEDVLRDLPERHRNCTYYLFDETCQDLVDLCAKDKKRVVACVKTKAKAKIESTSRLTHQYYLHLCGTKPRDLSCKQGDGYLDNIESIAYNLCYAYAKGNDPRATSEQIKKTFRNPYDYESNIECAVHVRSKLRCCGIENWYDKPAARRFAEKLENDHDGSLVESLSQLEHKRWCISKLLQGFRLPPDLSKIYSDTRIGTHDEKKKWHVCLVPYEESRKLSEADWIAADPDAIEGLDELDRQTLRVHKTCGKMLETADLKIAEYLSHIRTYDTLVDAADKPSATEQQVKLHICVQELKTSVNLLRNGDRDARYLYNRSTSGLQDLLSAMDADAKKKRSPLLDETSRNDLRKTLAKLDIHVGVWIEYITRKDYKEQNRILVRQIPFALSKFQDLTIVKLMSDKKEDCLSSAWQLEPARMVFVDFADSIQDLVRIWQMSKQIDYFLEHYCNKIQSEYHIFLCGKIQNLQKEYPEFFEKFSCTVHAVASADSNQIRPEFVELMRRCDADYIDLTGGKPELVSIADGYARNSHVGACLIRNEQLRSLYGAEALHGKLLSKGLSVPEMFAQSGAKTVKSDGKKLIGRIETDYDVFLQIAKTHAEYWHGFCMKFITKVCDAAKNDVKGKNKTYDPLWLPRTHVDNQIDALKGKDRMAELANKCGQILDDLVQAGLIHERANGYRVTSPELLAALRNSGKVLEYYIYFTAKKCSFTDVVMSYQFKHADEDGAVENELDVICTKDIRTLFISAKNVSKDKSNSKEYLKHVCYEVDVLASRFGINPKRVLAAPNAKQFENDELSEVVDYCMQRGVYLLGSECFTSGKLDTVLKNIMAEKQDWCGFLKPQPAGTK